MWKRFVSWQNRAEQLTLTKQRDGQIRNMDTVMALTAWRASGGCTAGGTAACKREISHHCITSQQEITKKQIIKINENSERRYSLPFKYSLLWISLYVDCLTRGSSWWWASCTHCTLLTIFDNQQFLYFHKANTVLLTTYASRKQNTVKGMQIRQDCGQEACRSFPRI